MYIATLLGLALGTLSGILPGIHPNLLSAIIIQTQLQNQAIIIFIAAMTYTFLSVIPTIHLSSPDPESALALHPSQQYTMKGKSHEAVLLTLVGALISLCFMVALTPFFTRILKPLYYVISKFIPFLLLLTALFLILHQKRKILAAIIFVSSGVLGYVSLNSNMTNPLLPLFTGLFGIPSLIINTTSSNIKQKITEPSFSKKSLKTIFGSLLYGSFFSFLPSLGPAQAATVQSQFSKNKSKRDFLILTGCLNMINTIFSVVTLMELNVARNGAVAIIKDLGYLDPKNLYGLIFLSMIVAFPCTVACLVVSRIFIKLKNKISTKTLSRITIIFLVMVTLIMAKIPGVILLLFASILGYIPYKVKTTKTTLMGCLMIPTMIFYFSRMF